MKRRTCHTHSSLWFKLIAIKTFLIVGIFLTQSTLLHSSELPSYCENFPAVGGDVRALKRTLQTRAQRDNDDVVYTLCREQETFPMKTVDLLSQWDQIERSMNSRGVKSFQEKLQEKVFRAIMKSTYDYLDLYPEKDCSKVSSDSMWTRDSTARRRCQESQDFFPQCGSNSSKFQRMMNEEHHFREQALNEEANQIIDLSRSVAAENGRELVERESGRLLSAARESIEENKRENFQRDSLSVTLQAVTIHNKKQQEVHRYDQEERRIRQQLTGLALSGISYTPYGMGVPAARTAEQQRVRAEQTRELQQRLDQLKTNHSIVIAELDMASAHLYEMNPTIFDQKESGLINRTVELVPSAFAKKIFEEAKRDSRISTITEPRAMAEFLRQESNLPVIEQIYSKIDYEENSQFLDVGRDKVFEELRKKKEAMEEICKGDGSQLHHYPKMVEEVLAESLSDPNQTFKDQAAYCYLLQTEPKKEGGSGILMGIGATLLIAGTVMQVVPVLGQVVGGSSLLIGGAIVVGGSMLAIDSADRYRTSRNADLNNQAIHQASSQWLGAEALLESRAKRSTQARIAFLEVATLPLDALFLAGPMARLMVKSGTTASRAQHAAVPAVNIATDATANVSLITPIDRFFDLSRAQRASQADEIVSGIRSTGRIDDPQDFLKAMMVRGDFNPSTFQAAERELAARLIQASSKDDALDLVRRYNASQGTQASAASGRNLENFVNEIFPSNSTALVVPGREVAVRATTDVVPELQQVGARSVAGSADNVAQIGTDALHLTQTGSTALTTIPRAATRGPQWGARTAAGLAAVAAGIGYLATQSLDLADVEQEEVEVTEEVPEEEVPAVPPKTITIQFKDGVNQLVVPLGAETFDFAVEAVVSEGDLPEGTWSVTCTAENSDANFCDEQTNFKNDQPSQSVKLYEDPKYVLTFNFNATEPGYVAAPFNVPLVRTCRSAEEGGPAVNHCEPAKNTPRSPAGESLEQVEPFWWEGLEPNMPPPPFTPGPPLRMRSFMLPGYI